MKFDMHVHTWSSDGTAAVRELVIRAKKIGLAGFAITDHNTVRAHRNIRKFKDVIIIPGEEISSEKGHVLAYMTNESVPAGLSVEETIEKIHEQGGVAAAAHPYNLTLGITDFLKHGFDAFEALNGYEPENHANKKLKKQWGKLPAVAGSDAHVEEALGTCYVKSPQVSSAEELLKNVLKKRTVVQGTPPTIREYVRLGKLMERKRIRKGRPVYNALVKSVMKIPDTPLVVANAAIKKLADAVDLVRLRNY